MSGRDPSGETALPAPPADFPETEATSGTPAREMPAATVGSRSARSHQPAAKAIGSPSNKVSAYFMTGKNSESAASSNKWRAVKTLNYALPEAAVTNLILVSSENCLAKEPGEKPFCLRKGDFQKPVFSKSLNFSSGKFSVKVVVASVAGGFHSLT